MNYYLVLVLIFIIHTIVGLRFCKYMNEHTSLNIESYTFLMKNEKINILEFCKTVCSVHRPCVIARINSGTVLDTF